MGMAASQARLLMITSRLHDVELKAQQLQNAKLQLSTQQDEVYEDYQKALDATTFTGNFIDPSGASSTVPITFNNLFSLGAATDNSMNIAGGANYILVDNRGNVVVDDDVFEGYQNFQANGDVQLNNAYAFAYYMVEGQLNAHAVYEENNWQPNALQEAIKDVFWENRDKLSDVLQNMFNAYHTNHPNDWPDQGAIDWALNPDTQRPPSGSGTTDPAAIFNSLLTWAECDGSATNTEKEEYQECVNYFWSHFGDAVFKKVNDNNGTNLAGDSYNKQAFDYYVRIYNAIQAHHGCVVPISDFNNTSGPAADNNNWLTAMLQSGQMTIQTIDVDSNGHATCSGATVASETSLSYTASSSIDKVALAHAEAEYEHALKVIDRKEQKIDRELNKIETERSALTKQYDSIKKVSDENIDRTFGIFS